LPKLVLILLSMVIGSIITIAILFQAKKSKHTYTPE
jgi:Flp pilus assembly protein protease CpaA